SEPDPQAAFLAAAASWRPLLEQYDIVQAYALDPAIPYAAEVPYFAYEHGTIREIPFEDSVRGRLCALTYRNAEAVFVTNIDNLASARRLGIDEQRIVPLPHAVDSLKLAEFANAYRDLHPPEGFLRVFAPARQDWVDGDPSWTKGND